MPQLMAGGVIAVSPNGVLGDPAGATAAEGERLLARLTDDLEAKVRAWHPPHGALGTPVSPPAPVISRYVLRPLIDGRLHIGYGS